MAGFGDSFSIAYTPYVNDSVPAIALLAGLKSTYLIADKGYDTNAILELAASNGQAAVIPPKANRVEQRPYDKHIYKERHLVECFFQKIKKYRAIATRHEMKNARMFAYFAIY